MTPPPAVDLTRFLKLRSVVARHGGTDAARWWNNQTIIGRRGARVLARGFPHTHSFIQARAAFAIACISCEELMHSPGCRMLWYLLTAFQNQFGQHSLRQVRKPRR
ncbi:MAG: BrxE family protein [Candidatus Tectimicrobiota bacterium]